MIVQGGCEGGAGTPVWGVDFARRGTIAALLPLLLLPPLLLSAAAALAPRLAPHSCGAAASPARLRFGGDD